MISLRSMTVPLFALATALVGCSAGANTTANVESVGDAKSVAAAVQGASDQNTQGIKGRGERHGFRGHGPGGGPDFLVHAALREPINLTDAQKSTIEGLVKAGRGEKPAFDATHAQKLAAAIRSNTVSQLQPPARDESVKNARIAESAKALATLHDTLTPEQRVALVDAIEKRAAEHQQKEESERKEGAERRGPEAREHGAGGREMHMLQGLDLTQEQKDAIKAKLDAARPAKPSEADRAAMKAKFEAMKTEMKNKLETFKSDKFDATAFVTPPAGANGMARPQGAQRPNELAIITSVLTPAQREALAKKIEQGPMHGPKGEPSAK